MNDITPPKQPTESQSPSLVDQPEESVVTNVAPANAKHGSGKSVRRWLTVVAGIVIIVAATGIAFFSFYHHKPPTPILKQSQQMHGERDQDGNLITNEETLKKIRAGYGEPETKELPR